MIDSRKVGEADPCAIDVPIAGVLTLAALAIVCAQLRDSEKVPTVPRAPFHAMEKTARIRMGPVCVRTAVRG